MESIYNKDVGFFNSKCIRIAQGTIRRYLFSKCKKEFRYLLSPGHRIEYHIVISGQSQAFKCIRNIHQILKIQNPELYPAYCNPKN